MARLDGKVAVITGASSGIGEATAEALASEGAMIVVAARREDRLNDLVGRIQGNGSKALAVECDVTDEEQAHDLISRAKEEFGRVDILVNNAGVTRDNLLFKMTDEDWRTVMEVHLMGAFLCSQVAQKHMVEGGYGRIVNVSSTSALGNRGQANYAAAKAGIQGFTKTLAIELGRFGITVNAVAPGFVETEMTRAVAAKMGVEFEDFVADRAKLIPVGRSGKPEDIAASILFFASEEAGFVSGQVLYAAGGPRT